MAFTSSTTNVAKHLLPAGKQHVVERVVAPPGLLRCLIVSWSEQRAKRLQSAAAKEAWKAISCSDAQQFLRNVFQWKVPLTLIDLPQGDSADYPELQDATAKAKRASDALLVICGAGEDPEEELWARQLGAWSYLPEVSRPAALEWVFSEARKALAKQAANQAEPKEHL